MESDSPRAHRKKSLLSLGTLLLCLAALQSPLWRAQSSVMSVPVRTGGATLITADRPIAGVAIDHAEFASAELVAEREVLVRGKALGEASMTVSMQDGHTNRYRVVVQSETARSFWGSLGPQ